MEGQSSLVCVRSENTTIFNVQNQRVLLTTTFECILLFYLKASDKNACLAQELKCLLKPALLRNVIKISTKICLESVN